LAKIQTQAVGSFDTTTRALSNHLQNPVISGVAALKGGFESEGDGQSSVHVCVDMQDIKNCLLDIRGQLDLGIKRVDLAFQLLEQKKCRGCVDKAGEMGLGERSP
jgi:hypothetical protein